MEQLIILALVTLVASGVGTLSGFGTSTIMVPVLALALPLPVVLLFVGIIHFFGDIWKMLLFRQGLKPGLLLAFGLPGIIAAYLGARIPLGADPALLKRLLGAFLVAYAAFILSRSRWRLPANRKGAFLGGALSGLFAGAFGVGGAVRGAFLSAFDLPRAVYIFTAGCIAFMIDFSRIVSYLAGGVRLPTVLALSLLLCIPVSFLGAFLAKKVVHKIPEGSFRSVIMVMLGLVALKLLFWP